MWMCVCLCVCWWWPWCFLCYSIPFPCIFQSKSSSRDKQEAKELVEITWKWGPCWLKHDTISDPWNCLCRCFCCFPTTLFFFLFTISQVIETTWHHRRKKLSSKINVHFSFSPCSDLTTKRVYIAAGDAIMSKRLLALYTYDTTHTIEWDFHSARMLLLLIVIVVMILSKNKQQNDTSLYTSTDSHSSGDFVRQVVV